MIAILDGCSDLSLSIICFYFSLTLLYIFTALLETDNLGDDSELSLSTIYFYYFSLVEVDLLIWLQVIDSINILIIDD